MRRDSLELDEHTQARIIQLFSTGEEISRRYTFIAKTPPQYNISSPDWQCKLAVLLGSSCLKFTDDGRAGQRYNDSDRDYHLGQELPARRPSQKE